MYYVLGHAHAPHSIALELCNQPLHNECTPVSKPITGHNRKSTWSSGAFSAANHLCVVLVLVHVQTSTRVFEIILGSPSQTRRNLCVLGREAEYADRGRFPNHHIQRHVY